VIKLMAEPETQGLNQPVLLEGRLPENDGEMVFEMPQYVSIERGSTTVGRGEVEYYGFVKPSSFTFKCYTEVYIESQAAADGQAKLDELRNGIAQTQAQDPSGQLPDLQAQLVQVNAQISQLGAELQALSSAQAVHTQINSLDQTAPDYQTQLALLNTQLADNLAQINGAQASFQTANASAIQIQTSIDIILAFQNKLATLKERLASGETALNQAAIEGQQKLDAGTITLENSKAELENGKAALAAGKIQGQETLNAAQNKIDTGWANLKAGEAQLAEEKAAGEKELSNAAQKLVDAEAEIASIDFGKWMVYNLLYQMPGLAIAVVVLYNLTNINISEHIREIATIRVLGFYDMEVYKYIFRENIVLSVIGILFGLGLGVILNDFIINTVETDIAMFGRGIELTSYLYSILFTLGFTMLVNVMMTPMIKKISMVESLKSIE